MRLLVRFMGFLFAAGTVVFLVGVGAVAGLIWHFSKDLPDYSQLQDYEPPVMTRVHAVDGSLLGEYAKERRLYLPIQAVPKLVINAFLAAEDKNFYEHGGIDYTGMARAGLVYIQNYGSNRRPQGASTITQQVAKNFLLTNEVSFARKIKEALLAMRIEKTYSKDKILELYLNEIYLGLGAYGIAAASLVYFDKSVNELTVAEASYLAALPKMPATLHPVRNRDRAIERRNYVIDRLQENGWIKQADADKARKEPLAVTNRSNGAHTFAGEYFAEEVRRDIFERYGEKKLYEGGLSVRTTLDPKIQVMARKTMVAGLVNYDEQQGYRGAMSKLDISGDWGVKLAEIKSLSDISPWRMAVVLETSDQSARIGFQPSRELGGAVSKQRETGLITLDGIKWARAATGPAKGRAATAVSQVLQPGDVIYADPLYKDGNPVEGQYRLRQIPEVSGAMVVMDPLDRPRARDGRRLLVRPEPVQPRHPGLPAAGLVVQADRLFGRARQRLYALDRGARRADRNRPGPGRRRMAAGKLLLGQVPGAGDAAQRAAAVAQHRDGAPRAGHRHAADRRICPPLRRL
ncbi:membrane carboxypeptidase/penicillin-binding protein [Bradyrhizobium diazoefficiens]